MVPRETVRASVNALTPINLSKPFLVVCGAGTSVSKYYFLHSPCFFSLLAWFIFISDHSQGIKYDVNIRFIEAIVRRRDV